MNNLAKYHLVSGMLLFLLGLIIGALIPAFTNSRMGLSAHLAGVQNGMFLLIIGVIWKWITLSPRAAKVTFGLNIFSMYGIWAALVLAAIWGTSRATPIAGAGHEAVPVQETFVQVFITVASIASLAAAAIMLVGLIRTRSERP